MMAVARDRTYADLLRDLRGRRVLIWTCGTCARLCGGLGGADVAGTVHSSACCLMGKAMAMRGSAPEGYDTVLALCCDVGARNAAEATGAEVLNPVRTLGPGSLDAEGRPMVAVYRDGRIAGEVPLEEAASRAGCRAGPFRCGHHLYARV